MALIKETRGEGNNGSGAHLMDVSRWRSHWRIFDCGDLLLELKSQQGRNIGRLARPITDEIRACFHEVLAR